MSKIIIVSNRLPLQIQIKNQDIEVIPSVGGLATGMSSVHRGGGSLWVGWSGLAKEEISKEMSVEINKKVKDAGCVAVSLTGEEVNQFYYGFSNKTLWPLFHYFMEYTEFNPDEWRAYKEVNRRFADVVMPHVNDGDTIWVHDYQLLLLPSIIKKQRPNTSIGFFLHIPFPSYEIFRTFPWREELLEGMLGADSIGFHTYDYERHFLSSVQRLLRLDTRFNEISYGNRIVRVDSFPMGIDYKKFNSAAEKHCQMDDENCSDLRRKLNEYLKSREDAKIILSIDRLDYTKGIPNRIKVFEYFLEKYPQYREKVIFIMLAVPSRSNVDQYQLLKKETDELVGRINGKFSTFGWTPIWYFYRSLPFDNLIDLYVSCDVAMITPLRDGMNLVAKEYIASRIYQDGVLILSEMAGAVKEMNQALFVNPNNFEQSVKTLKYALEMPKEEQQERNALMQKRLERYNVEKWAQEFMKGLNSIKDIQYNAVSKKMTENIENDINSCFRKAKQRLLFLDYDGTLVDFQNKPKDAIPDKRLYSLLDRLNSLENTSVVIISGRDKETFEQWYGDKDYTLITDHGVWMRNSSGNWTKLETLQNDWMPKLKPILETFVDSTPGTFIEEKNSSLAWHFRKIDPQLADIRSTELKTVLNSLTTNHNLSVLEGNKVIEIKSSNVNKGRAANQFLAKKEYDFIFAIGDDWTDEYMFEQLPEDAITIKVGIKKTNAKYFVDNVEQAREFLEGFIS